MRHRDSTPIRNATRSNETDIASRRNNGAPRELNPPDLLDLKLLQLFDLLYATRSVTRVAEQLGQSQPTVSIWLGRLRASAGDPLFVRTPERDGADAAGRCADRALPREILESLRLLRRMGNGSIRHTDAPVLASA